MNIGTYPGTATRVEALQLFDRTSMYGLPTNTYAPTFLHQRTPGYVNASEPGFAVDDEGFLVVFSW